MAVPLRFAHPAMKKEKVTWLGVTASAATNAVREQLKLPRGVGLVVDTVEEKGAAVEAGLKALDLLEKLNDQWLVNVEQFTTLVRSMKPGDEVTLSIVRQGARQAVKAKLGEKEVEVGAPAGEMFFTPMPGAPGGAVRTWTTPATPLRGVISEKPVRDVIMFDNVNGKQTTQWSDDETEVYIERDGDKALKVTAKDRKTGKVLYTGRPPAQGDPLLKGLPDLADKIRKAQEAGKAAPEGIHFLIAEDGAGAPGGGGGGGGDVIGGKGGGFVIVGKGGASRGKVVRWQDDEYILIMRTSSGKPLYLLALSKKDGRTIYDGPVQTDEQREGVPAEVAEQFKLVTSKPELATEFGGTTKGGNTAGGGGGGGSSATGGGKLQKQ
jgi:hypothetical protein